MNGHIQIGDIMGRVYWLTDALEDAYAECQYLAGIGCDLLVVRNLDNGRTVYVKDGQLSMYVKDGAEDWSKAR